MHNKVFRGSCFWRSSRRNENWFFFRLSSSYILKKRTLFRLQNKCSKTWDLVPWWPWPIPPNTASPTASHTTCKNPLAYSELSSCEWWLWMQIWGKRSPTKPWLQNPQLWKCEPPLQQEPTINALIWLQTLHPPSEMQIWVFYLMIRLQISYWGMQPTAGRTSWSS